LNLSGSAGPSDFSVSPVLQIQENKKFSIGGNTKKRKHMLMRLGKIFSYLRIIRANVKETLLIHLHWKFQSLARPGKKIKIYIRIDTMCIANS
jgi:hypothetical protein